MKNNIPDQRTKVWDIFIRIFHWTIVSGFILDMFLTDEGKWLHRWTGYVILTLILLRIIWGFIGTPHARFRDFFPTPKKLVNYLTQLFRGKEQRYIGHNPAGATMMIALIFSITGCCITGWMQGLDMFWGDEWLQETHELLANSILILAGLHILGAIIESFRHHENLIWSMVTGYKRAPSGTDVDHENPSS
ncbi:MAG: cytochrome B [Alphaproteobacteria bacterium CG1_02_46_17]|nr:MAG: cytochrome B [Alphaproteobacteria bacterium CG1_02_46_17]